MGKELRSELAQLVGRSCQLCQVGAAAARGGCTMAGGLQGQARCIRCGYVASCDLSPGPPFPTCPAPQAALRAEGVKVMELISKDPNSFSTGKGSWGGVCVLCGSSRLCAWEGWGLGVGEHLRVQRRVLQQSGPQLPPSHTGVRGGRG